LFLADLEAEGASVLTPSSATPDLVNDTGIILNAGGSAAANHSYVDSTKTLGAAVSSATATSLTCTTGDVFSPGDIIFVDTYNAAGAATPDSKFNAAYEELMVVLADGTTALTVDRGAFGTTANAVYEITDKIYILNGTATNVNNIIGKATTILKTKAKVTLASDSPSGSTTGENQKVIFKFTVTAENNAADTAENKVVLSTINLTTTKSGTTVKNVKLYPEENDGNASYEVVGRALSATKWAMPLSSLSESKNEVKEGTSRTYIVRGDVGSGTNTSNSLEVSIASLGSSDSVGDITAGDVTWTDGTTSKAWVDQAGASYIRGQALTFGASSGTVDTTAPTISTIVAANVATADSIAATDTITITFAEMIDPTTINASLVPGSSVTGVAAASTGGVTGVAADGIITVTGITTFDSGATLAEAASFTTDLALNAAGTVLTITLNTGTARVIGTPAMGTGTTVAGTVKDVNGTAMAAVASVLPTGSF
ncbi:MAG: hypothetical protein V1770_02865, partial [bacterium]